MLSIKSVEGTFRLGGGQPLAEAGPGVWAECRRREDRPPSLPVRAPQSQTALMIAI